MSVPKSLLSYTDCIDYFDTALRFTEGCRIPVPDQDFAFNLRMRLNNCRKLDRENNARIYPADHMMHGRSQYDKIMCKIGEAGGKYYVVLHRIDTSRLPVEGLGDPEAIEADPELVPISEQKQLPPPAMEMEVLEVEEAEPVKSSWRRL